MKYLGIESYECEILRLRSGRPLEAGSHRSDSPLRRRPDELVHLKLKTDVEPIGQNPFDDFARIDSAKDWREQNGVTASGQIEPVNVLP